MKKIFTLLVMMCIALCSYAEDLTFSVEVEGNTVIVTPSDPEVEYLCAAIGEEEAALFAQASGVEINVNTPERLFLIARGMYKEYKENLFTGTAKLTCHEGTFYLVMCGVEMDEEGKLQATTAISAQEITIGGSNPGGEDLEPLTFTFECDNDGFTVTPSDDVQEYFACPINPKQVESFLDLPAPLDDAVGAYVKLAVSYGMAQGHIDKGISHHLLTEYLDEGEDFGDGRYLVALVGVKSEGDRQIVTSPIYVFDWIIDHSEAGIRDIDAVSSIFKPSKVYKSGKIIINGRVNLDGTLVR